MVSLMVPNLAPGAWSGHRMSPRPCKPSNGTGWALRRERRMEMAMVNSLLSPSRYGWRMEDGMDRTLEYSK